MTREFLDRDEPCAGLQRLSAFFAGHAYAPHRHETYAIGVTLTGVQAFRYRGAERASRPGHTLVIHPDEVHDGHAGDGDGFSYRMIYVAPDLVRRAGHCDDLPFVPDVVAIDHVMAAIVADAFDGAALSEPLAVDAWLARLSDALGARSDGLAKGTPGRKGRPDIEPARQLLDAQFHRPITSSDLERVSGVDRFTLARCFRAALGTSPHRYLVGRRLAAARRAMAAGATLADAAVMAGFADQSHMTRHFKAHIGITPGRYLKLRSGIASSRRPPTPPPACTAVHSQARRHPNRA